MEIRERLKNTFKLNRILPRLIASWLFIAFVILLRYGFGFSDLSFAQDLSIVFVLVLVVFAFAVYSVPAFFLNKFHTDSWAVVISGFSLFVHLILKGNTGSSGILSSFAYSIILSLIFLYFTYRNRELIEKLEISKLITIIIIAALGFIFLTFMSAGLISKYKAYGSPNFDFGIFAQVFYNLNNHMSPLATCERDRLLSHFAVHVSPIFYIALPIYFIAPYAETVQFIQCLFVMSGLIPLTLIMFNHKMKHRTMIIVALIYCLYPYLSTGGFYDFHENCFLVMPLLFLFYFAEKKNVIGMSVFTVLTLMVKEDAAIYVLVFAIYLLINGKVLKDFIVSGSMAIVSLAYFFIITSVLNTSGDGAMYYRYGNLIYNSADGMIGAFKTILINPGLAIKTLLTTSSSDYNKLIYFLELLTPLAFIPFMVRKPSRLLLVCPILLNLLTNYVYQYDITFQYSYGISAFLLYVSILNLSDMDEKKRPLVISVMLAFSISLYLDLVFPTQKSYIDIYDTYREYYDKNDELLSMIPADASVSAYTFYLPHLSSREVIYETYYHGYDEEIDYIVLRSGDDSDEKLYKKYMESGLYSEIANENSMIILKKND